MTAVGVVGAMRPVMLPALACASRHIVWLISNVSENGNTHLITEPLSLYHCICMPRINRTVLLSFVRLRVNLSSSPL